MKQFLFLMHSDTERRETPEEWSAYLAKLRASVRFEGGSAIGAGVALRKSENPLPLDDTLSGFLRVDAENLDEAKGFLEGNPTFEAGGTVEIRELPRS